MTLTRKANAPVPFTVTCVAAAFCAEQGIKRIPRVVVVLSEDGSYHYTDETTPGQRYFTPTDYRVFLACLTVKQWEMQHGLWSPQIREEEL